MLPVRMRALQTDTAKESTVQGAGDVSTSSASSAMTFSSSRSASRRAALAAARRSD
eukprot:CAMPEP_0197675874 /NCGR_PEP_ID=MMETSP1338-20131121/85768_1 /TAXON_ID=43686 ORGANISM="Pelagodinium beii, Strain RCC1491" /NCGR_SAMPLE_ID=MMETSP1338 /ASSEMBLY_ACC=CAM_ASM_000754 /LENGTH=55 /DNA_ID=CAMNT_0043256481 /DNA_START=32 /DNA_END=196 /DNA_ORIENTATION=+